MMPRFLITDEQIKEGTVHLSGEDARRISRVLRLRAGDRIILFDREGREYTGTIKEIRRGTVRVEPGGAESVFRESPLKLVLLQAIVRSNRMDIIIQKASELGVSSIQPIGSHRSIPRYEGQRAEMKLMRWHKIALEATKQCGRTTPPQIHPLAPLEETVRMWKETNELKLILWEGERERGIKEILSKAQPARRIILMVGPEGGFSKEEVALAKDCGFLSVSLGGRILRVETASIAALSIIQYVMGDLGGPCPKH